MTRPREAAVTKGLRVYEYTDQDGNLFFSFDRLPGVVTHSRTLVLDDRVGTHFDNFVAELRARRQLLLEAQKEEALGRG